MVHAQSSPILFSALRSPRVRSDNLAKGKKGRCYGTTTELERNSLNDLAQVRSYVDMLASQAVQPMEMTDKWVLWTTPALGLSHVKRFLPLQGAHDAKPAN